MWVGFSDDVLRGRLKKIVQASAIYLKLILPNLPAVGRILESDTLYYFLFHVGYKYPTYNLNGFLFQTTSNAAFFLDHQNPRFAARMGDVFRADSCVEDVAAFQPNDVFFAVFSVVHIDFAVHYGKHFLAVVDVPFVGLVRPVQAHGGTVHIGDVECAPCAGSGKFGGADGVRVGHFRVSLILYLDKPVDTTVY